MSNKKLKPGLPVRLDDKAVRRVPTPKPSRAQIIEALVTLKIEQVQAAREAYDKETQRLQKAALEALLAELPKVAGKFIKPTHQPVGRDQYGTSKGTLSEEFSLHFKTSDLSAETRKAIHTAWAHKDYDDKPRIKGTGGYSEDDVRRIVRKQIREQLEVQEGTHRNRLTAMLGDKTFRLTLENTLAKIEGKPAVQEAAEA